MMKAGLVRGPARQQPMETIEHVELAALGWVHRHNTTRLRGFVKDSPPVEFEHAFCGAQWDNPNRIESPMSR